MKPVVQMEIMYLSCILSVVKVNLLTLSTARQLHEEICILKEVSDINASQTYIFISTKILILVYEIFHSRDHYTIFAFRK